MKILVLTPQIPRFPGPGGEARQFCLLQELCSRHAFTVMPLMWPGGEHLLQPLRALGINVDPVLVGETGGDERPQGVEGMSLRSRLRERYPALAVGYREAQGAGRVLVEALRIFSPVPRRTVDTRVVGQAVRKKLAGIRLKAFDLIQVEHAEAGHWLSGLEARVPRLLVCHNVNSLIARRQAGLQAHSLRWLAAWAEWRKLQRYERRIAGIYENCVLVSDEDRAALLSLGVRARTWVVPNGVDPVYFQAAGVSGEETGSLVFTGTMFWEPNADAMISFCNKVLPRIRERHRGAHLTIVGAKPTQAVQRLAEQDGVAVTGTVADVRPYIAGASVYVVPLRIGGGTRLKILEAMAMGKAVVSTSVGCEGLGVTPGIDIEVADSPEAFAMTVCRLLDDPARRRTLGEAARKVVTDRYDWRIISRQQEAVYAAIAEGPQCD